MKPRKGGLYASFLSKRLIFSVLGALLIPVMAEFCPAAEVEIEEKVDSRMLEVKVAARVKDYSKMLALLKPMAMEGDPEAMYQLGGLYRSGKGVAVDVYQAYGWMKKAADKGHKRAIASLEAMEKKGWDKPRIDLKKENKAWYYIEAEQKKSVKGKNNYVNIRPGDKMQEDAFRLAAQKGQLEKVQIFVKSWIDVNAADVNGRTALLEAASFGHVDVVEYLLKNRALHDVRDRDGNDPLLSAVVTSKSKKRKETVLTLINYGAALNTQDKDNNTPLMLAVGKGLGELVEVFLEHNADQHIKNKNKKTAVQIAELRGHKKIAEFITRRGTKHNKPSHGESNTPVNQVAEDVHTPPEIKIIGAKDILTTAGWSTLMITAWQGQVKVVEALVAKGTDLDWQDEEGHTALSRAAWQGHDEVVDLLLKAGAKSDIKQKNGMTALFWAAKGGKLAIVNKLVDAGVQVNQRQINGNSPLFLAVDGKHQKTTAALMTAGAECNIKREDGLTPLLLAASNGQEEIVEILIKYGADVNAVGPNGQSALWYSAVDGNNKIIKNLLAQKVSVERPDNDGQTPLFMAATKGHLDIIQEFLKVGALATTANKLGNTPLMMAANNGHHQVVALLMAKYSKIDQKNLNGNTALMLAVTGSHLETVRVLLEAGANPHKKNIKRESARQLAGDNKDMLALIEKYGGAGNLLKLLGSSS